MKKYTLAAAIVAIACATNASAATLTIDGVSGVWQNDVPDYGVSGEGTTSIRWGNPAGWPYQQSGYDWVNGTPPAIVANEGDAFSLGTFTHLNFPVTGTSLNSADLEVGISIENGPVVNTVYNFEHLETPNNAYVCAAGGSRPCPDLVTAALDLGASESFTIGTIEYVFNVLGFSTDGGQTITDSFLTLEEQSNSAELFATFTTRSSVVPLPAAGWLLVAGIGGLAAMGRRRQKNA